MEESLSAREPQDFFSSALRLPLRTAGSVAEGRGAAEIRAMFPPGSDGAALQKAFPRCGMRLAVFGSPGDGFTSGPFARQRGVNSPNDERLADGPMRRAAVKMSSCSSRGRHLKMETVHDL